MSMYDTLHHRSGVESTPDIITVQNWMSPEQCQDLIEQAIGGGFKQASTIPQNRGEDHKPDYRVTDEFYLDDEVFDWVWRGITQTVIYLNHRIFEYDITGLEPPVVLRYTGGSHYKWHRDMGGDYTAYRKLSVVVQLSDPHDYTGGRLEYFSEGVNTPENRDQGTLYIFPSWMNHRVTEVTTGCRYALVCWSTGIKLR